MKTRSMKRKRKEIASSSTNTTINLPDLPPEILEDILVRLPVKSLCRFRCVSKPWCNLISSKKFTKLHLNRSTSSDEEKFDRQRLFFCAAYFYSIEVEDLPYYMYGHAGNVDYNDKLQQLRFDFDLTDVYVVGACNGLVCLLLNYERYVVLNPCTRECNELPHSGLYADNESIFSGIGYDAFTDDYKIVQGICYKKEDGSCESVVKVYSVKNRTWKLVEQSLLKLFSAKTRSWRMVEQALHFKVRSLLSVFSNGLLHWQARIDEVLDFIVSFNLKEEIFEVMFLPDSMHRTEAKGLGVLDGCVSAVIEHNHECDLVYTMKEYGVNDSWTRMIELPKFTEGHIVYPLCYTKDGHLVMHIYERNTEYLSIYNFKEEISSDIRLAIRDRFQVAMYSESLVSPYGDNGEE